MSKCECKVVRKFALGTKKLMHSLCPTDKAKKWEHKQLIRNACKGNYRERFGHSLGTVSLSQSLSEGRCWTVASE